MKACRIPSGYVRFAWLPGQHCFPIKHCSSKVKIHWHHRENTKNVEYWWFSLWTLDQVNYWRIQGSASPSFFFPQKEKHIHDLTISRPLCCLVEKKKIQLIILTLLKQQFYQKKKCAPHCKYCDQVLHRIVGLSFKIELLLLSYTYRCNVTPHTPCSNC